ncbi:peptidoglycan-binding protein LysM [Phyllobacterium brassicacearum]|uniref:Peptidoglycan-binding protein LysM n=1 Tax=Phyllobacterium brassicacearum TaxID=314235 RepID=A0A2P7BUQ9_9HYPH|nr:LysM domain-containing protein [Phyllobacterium brassicacearum]PSH70205.1 peptidoglycan-binding protein LysM [Phyllobacterium brassicacearum]TDQ33906.1 LysM domain-containing protein [Phyllobacterium brassicacearum]
MSYRIDIDGRSRYNAAGNQTSPVADQQQRLFVEQIRQAVRERAEGGGPNRLDPLREKTVVVERGDNLWTIARENNVTLDDLLATNRITGDAAIRPDEVLIVPQSSPEVVANGSANGNGVPEGEAAFISDLYDRGNQLAYADDPSRVDYDGETRAMQREVGTYLDNLPAPERQAAALRLAQSDWLDAGPAGNAVTAAIEERGLETDPEAAFAAGIYDRGNAVQYSESPNIDYQAETNTISSDVKSYIGQLPESERSAALQRLFDRNWQDAAPARNAIEDAAEDLGIALRPSTHAGVEIEDRARQIIDEANATGKPDEAFRQLSEAYNSASPELRQVLLRSEDASQLVTNASEWAARPLAEYDPETAVSDQGDAATTMMNLEKLTDGADPRLAVDLVSAAMPTIEAANARKQREIGGQLIGLNGQADMMKIIDRISGTPGADRIVETFVQLGGYHPNSIPPAITSGSSLDYPIAFAAESATGSPEFVTQSIMPHVEQYATGTVNRDVVAYAMHMQELQWLITNHGATMTPEQLTKAIEDYKKEKGPDWIATEQRLEDNIASSGEKLLAQLTQLGDLPPELASQQSAVNDRIAQILSDEKTAMAIDIAMKKKPELLDKPQVLNLLGSQARLSDRGRKLAEEATTQIVRRMVLPSFGDLSNANPASIERARASLENLRDSKVSTLLGIPEGDMNKAIDALKRSMPEPGDTLEQARAKMAQLDSDLNGLKSSSGVRSFANTAVPGQLLRMIGVAATGATLANSSTNLQNDPTLKNSLKVVIDVAGLGQRTVEILGGMERIDPESASVRHFGSSSRPAVKFLGALSAGFDAWNAVDYFKSGDPLMGSLSAVAAGGTVMAALGTGTMFGPAGLVIVGAAVIGQMIVGDTRHSNIYMTDTSKHFLEHADLDERVAGALVDQSGDGHSPVPMLAKYAEMKGYELDQPTDRQQFVNWLNSIPNDKLEALRDNIHHTLDDFGGDVSRLTATADGDANYTDPDELNYRYTGSDVYVPSTADRIRSGEASPSSVAQIDVVLAELGIGIPVA